MSDGTHLTRMNLAGRRRSHPCGVTVWAIDYPVDGGETIGEGRPLRSASPELVRQGIWAHLTLHPCLNRIIMRPADGEGPDPDRISFVKILKHTRRSVDLQAGRSPRRLQQFMKRLATKVVRKLDKGGPATKS
ncbi:hypothetical protein V1460_15455 [Streptomyces sp. SCSIO 30461]|uniref:hypothetical protein n=1 Tax=Streptomyces sp. SCSIO 30461 TaxID=3118085 RepID=UPI0030CBC3D2